MFALAVNQDVFSPILRRENTSPQLTQKTGWLPPTWSCTVQFTAGKDAGALSLNYCTEHFQYFQIHSGLELKQQNKNLTFMCLNTPALAKNDENSPEEEHVGTNRRAGERFSLQAGFVPYFQVSARPIRPPMMWNWISYLLHFPFRTQNCCQTSSKYFHSSGSTVERACGGITRSAVGDALTRPGALWTANHLFWF